MGRYLDKGNLDFAEIRRSEYVDKSPLIQVVNETLATEFRCSCVSRCRRFGKSVAAKMLYAYYDRSSDSRALFEDLAIATMPTFEEHLNRYPTLYLDMTQFTTRYPGDKTIVRHIQQAIQEEIRACWPDIPARETDDLMDTLFAVADRTKERFVMIIDEWDAICREFNHVPGVMDEYVNWLRRMFKTGDTAQVFVGVYMTGILPIKKYQTQSALNNFCEYSMVSPGRMASSFGFTAREVEALCAKHGMDYGEMAQWYDGYQIGREPSMFNPYSVMQALRNGACGSYFATTAAFTNVADYIQMDFEGLKDDVITMLAGGRCWVNTTKFQNDIATINSKDDVLTVLIHLGYLSYDASEQECYVPNQEIRMELTNAVEATNWTQLMEVIQSSRRLLQSLWAHDEETVAAMVDRAHDEHTSVLSYHNENSMACVLEIAFIAARNHYTLWRELPTGKGFADVVLLPRRTDGHPAVVLELKYNQSADTAIDQIHRRQYPARLTDYQGPLLLVGLNYDKATKRHTCHIEEV